MTHQKGPPPTSALPKRFAFARRFVIAILGGTVLLVGIAMVALPGPAMVVIPIGLGILALEFAWARSLLKRSSAELSRLRDNTQKGFGHVGRFLRKRSNSETPDDNERVA